MRAHDRAGRVAPAARGSSGLKAKRGGHRDMKDTASVVRVLADLYGPPKEKRHHEHNRD
jgi:hypothetical protein